VQGQGVPPARPDAFPQSDPEPLSPLACRYRGGNITTSGRSHGTNEKEGTGRGLHGKANEALCLAWRHLDFSRMRLALVFAHRLPRGHPDRTGLAQVIRQIVRKQCEWDS